MVILLLVISVALAIVGIVTKSKWFITPAIFCFSCVIIISLNLKNKT